MRQLLFLESGLKRYGIAVGAVLAALAVQSLLARSFGDRNRTTELNDANTSLRELPARRLKVQDEGRRRIARELHDGIGQYLASLKCQIHQIERLAKENSAPSNALLSETCETIDHCISEVRTISHLLHPPLIDELGLLSAIRRFVEGFSKRSGVAVTIELPEMSSRFPAEIELALFRVLQESLTNVHRHSGCSAVTVRLDADEKELRFHIKDNGRGIPKHGPELGVGIIGMHERVREIFGQLTISSDGSGTTVAVTVPLDTRVKADAWDALQKKKSLRLVSRETITER